MVWTEHDGDSAIFGTFKREARDAIHKKMNTKPESARRESDTMGRNTSSITQSGVSCLTHFKTGISGIHEAPTLTITVKAADCRTPKSPRPWQSYVHRERERETETETEIETDSDTETERE